MTTKNERIEAWIEGVSAGTPVEKQVRFDVNVAPIDAQIKILYGGTVFTFPSLEKMTAAASLLTDYDAIVSNFAEYEAAMQNVLVTTIFIDTDIVNLTASDEDTFLGFSGTNEKRIYGMDLTLQSSNTSDYIFSTTSNSGTTGLVSFYNNVYLEAQSASTMQLKVVSLGTRPLTFQYRRLNKAAASVGDVEIFTENSASYLVNYEISDADDFTPTSSKTAIQNFWDNTATVPTIASVVNVVALTALDPGAYDGLFLNGYRTANDGGQGLIFWNSTDTRSPDGVTIFQPDSVPATGRWNLFYQDTLNVLQAGAYDDGTNATITTAAINSVKTILPTGNIVVSKGDYALDANISTVKTQNLIMHMGAKFEAASPFTVTIPGGFEKPLDTAFGTNITVDFTGNGLTTYPQWWGSAFDNVAVDDEVGIQACINAFKRGNKIKFFSASGSFKTSATIYIDTSYVDLDWNYVQCDMGGKAFPCLAIGQQANGSVSSSGVLEPTIRKMWVSGDRTVGSVGCLIRKTTQVRLYEPHLTDCQYGIENDGIAGGQESLICGIHECHIVGNTKGIYDTGGFQGSTFHGGRIEDNREEGIWSDSPNVILDGTVIEGNNQISSGGLGDTPEISLGGGGGWTFLGTYMESQSKTHTSMIDIRLGSTKELSFIGARFFANDAVNRYIVESASTSNQTVTFSGGLVSDSKNFISINAGGNSLVTIGGVFDNQNNNPVDDLGVTPYLVHTRLHGFATDRKMDLTLSENRLNGIGGTYFDGFNSKFTRVLSGDDYPWNETISSFTSGIFYMRKNGSDVSIYQSTDSTNVVANWRKIVSSFGYRKEYTIATDIITLDGKTGNILLDTQSNAASDDLWQVAGVAEDGDIIILQTINNGRDVTVYDMNTGGAPGGANIQLLGGNIVRLWNNLDSVLLMYQGLSGVWKEISRTGISTSQDVTFSNLALVGSLDIGTEGAGISIQEGSNGKMGVGTLASGIATISTAGALTNSRIFITNTSAGANIYRTAIVDATSFSVSDGSGSSSTTFEWLIVDPS